VARRAALSRENGKSAFLLAYFGLLGAGYMAIEIPLVQRLVLFLDHPTISFVIVIALLLVFSGIGSMLAQQMPVRWMGVLIVAYLGLVVLLLGRQADVLLQYSLLIRLIAIGGFVGPLGLLMGVPFPAGLRLLRAHTPEFVPWAWAINSSTSVTASVLAALIALQWGFGAVHLLAVLVYLAAWGIFWSVHASFARRGEA
jgi:hypothetical protein